MESIRAPVRMLAFCWLALLDGIIALDDRWHRMRFIVNGCLVCLADAELLDHHLVHALCLSFYGSQCYHCSGVAGLFPILSLNLLWVEVRVERL